MLRISNVASLARPIFQIINLPAIYSKSCNKGLRIHRGSRPRVYCPNKFPAAKQAFIAIKLEPLIRASSKQLVFSSSRASHKNLPQWKRDFSLVSLSRSEQPGITKSNRKGTTLTTLGNVKRARFILSWLLTSFPPFLSSDEIQVFFSKTIIHPSGELASCCKITRLQNQLNITRSIF